MSTINIRKAFKFNGTFRDEENGVFDVKFGVIINDEAPENLREVMNAVKSSDENPENRTIDGLTFVDVEDIIFDLPEYFDVAWVDSDLVDDIDLEELDDIESIR